jgi:hypothetical protein
MIPAERPGVVIVGVRLSADGVAHNICDMPTPRTALVALVILLGACGQASSGIEDVSPDEVTATVLGVYDVDHGAISNDGGRLLGLRNENGETVDVCVFEVDTDEPPTCHQHDRLVVGTPVTPPRWSPNDVGIVWSGLFDIIHFDVETGEITNLTDDGYLDGSEESLGLANADAFPAWLDEETIVFLRGGRGGEPLVEVVAVDLDGFEIGHRSGPTHTVETPAGDLTVSAWAGFNSAPFVTDGGSIMMGGEGVVHAVDPATWELTEVGGWGAQYEPYADALEGLGIFVHRPGMLVPIAELEDGRLLLWDGAILTAMNQGLWSGLPSGVFVFDPDSGDFEPLVATSATTEGYLGPLVTAISPNGRRVVVSWLDAAAPNDRGFVDTKLSVIDLEAWEGPVDLRSVPELWSVSDFLFLLPLVTWAENDRFAVQGGEGTYLFELGVTS